MDLKRRDLLLGSTGLAAAWVTPKLAAPTPAGAQAVQPSTRWDREADVVIIGSGATGMPAAIVAREAGSSVIVIEAEADIGGHAICSGANIPLGGGTSIQKRAGIEDSPDLVFRDLTDWSLTGRTAMPITGSTTARSCAPSPTTVRRPSNCWSITVSNSSMRSRMAGRNAHGNSVPRQMHWAGDWPMVQTGASQSGGPEGPVVGQWADASAEAAAARPASEFLLEHRMTAIHRAAPNGGRVLGIAVTNAAAELNIRARKAVIIGTGGSSGNVNFRRMFDPRLTEEYCGLAGMPWSNQDASGEMAGMAIGASLWGASNQTGEFGDNITKPGKIGCQYGYRNLTWMPGSRVFDRARAGLRVGNWQDVILVNMLGKRFYDETGGGYPANATTPSAPISRTAIATRAT